MSIRRALLLALLLAGCSQPAKVATAASEVAERAADTAAAATDAVVTPAETAQEAVIEAVAPPMIALQDAIETVIPPAPLPPAVMTPTAELILRWEVGSRATYERKYQGLICPGGASGPTGGIGYDFGHQSRATILRDWADHTAVERLATASGVMGDAACRAWVAQHRDIRIPLAHAERVFVQTVLPAYQRMSRRALGPAYDTLSEFHQGGNDSLGYNRGWSLIGDRNSEKRVIVRECVPANDPTCTAAQLNAMCRIWRGTPLERGLCGRRADEARFVVRLQ